MLSVLTQIILYQYFVLRTIFGIVQYLSQILTNIYDMILFIK